MAIRPDRARAEREHVQLIYLPNRKRAFSQMHPKQGTCRANRQLRHLLGEVFQARQRTRALLHLVKNQQILFQIDRLVEKKGEILDDSVGTQVIGKQGDERFLLFKVDVMAFRKAALPKRLQRVGLPHLPRALEKKRLPAAARPPLLEFSDY